MTDGSQFIDIILFAMVAVFLGLRLRSVLGRRTGNEPPPPETGFRGPAGLAPTPAATDNIVDLTQRRRPNGEAAPAEAADPKVAAIRAADPSFSAAGFLQGAKAAFEMILGAFARGDERALRPLLADQVYDSFSQAIQARVAAHEVCQSELVSIQSADLVDARMTGSIASVGVRFVSQQIIVVRDAQGAVAEGDPTRPVRLIDVWTFSRDTRSTNPNWLLVATSSQDE